MTFHGWYRDPSRWVLIEGADPTLTYTTSINEKFINLDAIRDEDYRNIVFDVGVADYTFCQLSKSRSLMYMMSRLLLFNFRSRNWIHFHYTMFLLSLVFPCSVRLPATNHAAYHNSTKQWVANLPPSQTFQPCKSLLSFQMLPAPRNESCFLELGTLVYDIYYTM
ncbi:hypothetical protein PM082_012653 [Marasmius tenuissimus]|nr:hypothetical protein PM082_012653 [Marasmius tenuissimus]